MFDFTITNWMLVFARVSALHAIFPIFSARHVPIRIRTALGAMVALLVAPGLAPYPVGNLNLAGFIILMVKELAAGLVMGFVCRMIFYALDVAGNIISMQMGLNTAAMMSPVSDSRTDMPAMILYYLGIVLFLSLDMHHWMLLAFQKSYAVLPIGDLHMQSALFEEVVGMTSRIFVVGLQMAAPMLALSFLLALIFSVLGRAVPQMNVFAESFTIRTLAGLATFGMTLHLMAQYIQNYLRRLPEDMIRISQLLGG